MKIDPYESDSHLPWLEKLSDFDTDLSEIPFYDLTELELRLKEASAAIQNEITKRET